MTLSLKLSYLLVNYIIYVDVNQSKKKFKNVKRSSFTTTKLHVTIKVSFVCKNFNS